MENAPDHIVGEHLLALAAAEGGEIAAGASVDGEADDLVGGDDAAEGREQGVVEGEENVALEPHPAVGVAGGRVGPFLLDGGARDGLEGEGLGRRDGETADEEDHALGAATEDRDRLQIPEVDRRRRRRRQRLGHQREGKVTDETAEHRRRKQAR